MKFFTQKDRLTAAIQDVLKAVATRTTIPILTGIKIEADKAGIKLTASDSDISIESFIPAEEEDKENAEIIETGAIVLPARFFSEIVRKLPESVIDLEVVDHFKTIIRSGNIEYNLNGLDAEEYPRLPKISEDGAFTLPADLLKTLIRQTVFAVSTSETRPILTGVNWKIENNQLTAVATDSHRLAMKKVPLNSSSGGDKVYNIVIPGKSLNELVKILDDSRDQVEIVITGNHILFKAKNMLFLSRLLEGNYPDTSRLIPTDSKTVVKLDAKEYYGAVDRASLLAREAKNNVIKFSTVDQNTVEISSYTPEVGKVVEKIRSLSMEGEDIKISFNALYMMDALRAADGTELTIYFTGAMRPFVIKTDDDDSLVQLLLPVRTF